MLKTAIFDCAINEKCYNAGGGRGICPLSRPHPGGFDSSRVPTPGNSLPRGTERGWLKLSIVVSAGINVLMK